MLIVFVNHERDKIYYATYDENKANEYCIYNRVKLAGRYFNDVEIWEVVE